MGQDQFLVLGRLGKEIIEKCQFINDMIFFGEFIQFQKSSVKKNDSLKGFLDTKDTTTYRSPYNRPPSLCQAGR